MRNIFLTLLIFTFSFSLKANDGAYYVSGNHLIPIEESAIVVKKEVLTIKKINLEYVEVLVEYDFFNPGNEKTILVGFEAPSPNGDVNGAPLNGAHPNIKNFSVLLNSIALPFKTAIVTDSNYYQNKKIISKTETEVLNDEDFNSNWPDFYYVYYFNAAFKKGTNKIIHKYQCRLSNSVETEYSFSYILTAANRWANKQIDDFTLIIDMGSFQKLAIEKTFFKTKADWTCPGKIVDTNSDLDRPVANFYIQEGQLVFRKQNFHPEGELSFYTLRPWDVMENDKFNYKETILPFPINHSLSITQAEDEISFKIVKNLPFARRGYIFKTPEIKQYYEKLDWYKPNPEYKATLESLTKEEQNWLNEVNKKNFK